jgi:hypothetical protein
MNRPERNYPTTNLFRTILLAGMIVGTMDGVAAAIQFIVMTWRNPLRVFQYIASGIFFAGAYASEWMAVWGVLFHFYIATGWEAIFLVAYRKYARIRKHAVVSGLLYRPVVRASMSQMVLPLSNVQLPVFSFARALVAMLILWLCIGIPLGINAKIRFGREYVEDNVAAGN